MYIKHKGMHIKHHTYLCLVSPVAIKRSKMMSSSVKTSLVRKRSTSIFICPWESRDDTVRGNSSAGSMTITGRHTFTIYVRTHALYFIQNRYYLAQSLPIHSLYGKQTRISVRPRLQHYWS